MGCRSSARKKTDSTSLEAAATLLSGRRPGMAANQVGRTGQILVLPLQRRPALLHLRFPSAQTPERTTA
jgi:hypothetical protein